MNWTYKGKEVASHEDLPIVCTNFVYILTFESGKQYVGKKTIRSVRRLKPTKKQLAIRKNYVRRELKDLPFVNYEGSSKENEHEVLVSKRIIHLCGDSRSATYIEMAELVSRHAIFSDDYTNKNILGAHFDNALDKYLEGEDDGN